MNSLRPSLLPFAVPEAGFDYFATQTHYRSLACRVLTALGGFNIVVVTGDRLSGGPMVGSALGEAAAGRYIVIGFQSEPEQGQQDAIRFHTAVSASLPRGSAEHRDSDVPALLVFYDTDRYSDIQIEKILTFVYQQARVADHRITAAVFLARTEFLARLEHPALRAWLVKRLLVARLRFDELGADEIRPFISHQLPPAEAEKTFTDEAIAAIANVSGGDPVVVNRFSRRMLDRAAANTGNKLETAHLDWAGVMSLDTPREKSGATTETEQPNQNYPEREPDAQLLTRISRNRSARVKLSAGIALCFASFAVVIGAVFIRPAVQDIAASSPAPAAEIPAKPPESTSLTVWASRDPSTASRIGKAPDVPDNAALTAVSAPASRAPEDTLAHKTQSVAALRPPTEPATPKEIEETLEKAAAPLAPSTEAQPDATAESPTGIRAPSSTSSMRDPLPTAPTPEEAATVNKAPALPKSEAPIPATTELVTTNEAAAVPLSASAEVSPTATAVSPAGTEAPKSTDLLPAQLRLPAAEIAALLARGDALFARRDLSSARLFYERAANAGDGRAALRLGNTYDPVFLDFAHLRATGDAALAGSWYSRARELGDAEAEILLTAAHRHHEVEVIGAQRKSRLSNGAN